MLLTQILDHVIRKTDLAIWLSEELTNPDSAGYKLLEQIVLNTILKNLDKNSAEKFITDLEKISETDKVLLYLRTNIKDFDEKLTYNIQKYLNKI